MVRKFIAPDHTTKTGDAAGAQAWMGELENALAVEAALLGQFAPRASMPPDNTVTVGPGNLTNRLGIVEQAPDWTPGGGVQGSILVYGSGVFKAITGGGSASTGGSKSTDDGQTWAAHNMPASAVWKAAAFGNGVFVAIATNASNKAAYSTPSGNWVASTLPASITWQDVAFGNGVFVAISSTTAAATSPDGVTWTAQTVPNANGYLCVAYGAGLFVALGGIGNRKIATSPDGVTWTDRGTLSSNGVSRVIYSQSLGLFLAVAKDATGYYTSSDGIAWTLRNFPKGATYRNGLAERNGVIVATPDNAYNDVAYVTTDGISWEAWNLCYSTNWPGVAASASSFVAIPTTNYSLSNRIPVDYKNPDQAVATTLLPVASQASPGITFPSTNPRIDRIGIDALSGSLVYLTGAEAANPVAPPYRDGMLPVCRLSLSPGQTVVTNYHITDERGLTNADSPGAVLDGAVTAYNDGVSYKMFSVAGTYSFPRPAQASFYRITLIGAGGGCGGKYTNGTYTTDYLGGCGGGGGTAIAACSADDLTIVVGTGGAAGANSTPGVNDATAGSNGTASTATLATSGTVLTANPGNGGGRGVSTPAVGAGGAGGAATLGGFAGGSGGAGISGSSPLQSYIAGGATGEQLVFTEVLWGEVMGVGGGMDGTPRKGSDGVVVIEWW